MCHTINKEELQYENVKDKVKVQQKIKKYQLLLDECNRKPEETYAPYTIN